MTIERLGRLVGDWEGTNGFRLMPDDELAVRPATATLAVGAGGHLVSLAYRWEHPQDGPQDGLVLVGAGEGDDGFVGLWGDSWHQQPQPRPMSGPVVGGAIRLEAEYGGGWRWHLLLGAEGADGTALRMRMENVVPADHDGAGPYEVMVMDLHRGD